MMKNVNFLYLNIVFFIGFWCKIDIIRVLHNKGAYCMKKLNVIPLVFIVGLFGSCLMDNNIKGNGNLITSEKPVSLFEKINIAGSAEVRFYASQEYQVKDTVDSNLLEYTEIKTRGNTLNIGTISGNYSLKFTKYLVEVYCPAVSSVSISGSGRFVGIDSINAPAFTAVISGSGNILITGNSGESDIDISGSGNFNGDEFCVNKAVVRISGAGKANINVSEYLNANISGSGIINYSGNPKVDSKISGTGQLNKL